MDGEEGFFLGRHAASQRTGGCLSRLFRGGIPGAGTLPPPQTAGPRLRGDWALLSRPPLRGGSRLSGGLERTIPRIADGPDTQNGDALQRPVWDAPDLLS